MAKNRGPPFKIHNNYITSILPPFKRPPVALSCDSDNAATKNTTFVAITPANISKYSDVTHIGWKPRIDYSMKELEESKKRQCTYNLRKNFITDPNKLLEVTISTILLAATGNDVPKEHLLYSLLYLRSIKNGCGDHPPNISNFIKYLNFLRRCSDDNTNKTMYHIDTEMKMKLAKHNDKHKLSKTTKKINGMMNCENNKIKFAFPFII